MNHDQTLSRMVAPSHPRPSIWRKGVLQIWVTRACDKRCFHCTQNSQFGGKAEFITPDQYETALNSLNFGSRNPYFGVVGMFGGNPALHPQFETLCEILRSKVPYSQRGLWCNHPRGKGRAMQATFCPEVSNLNVHQDQEAWDQFLSDWPATRRVINKNLKGIDTDSRHGPPLSGMSDFDLLDPQLFGGQPHDPPVPNTEENRNELIAKCDINRYWSAMICVFRKELRAYFCEIAGAMAMLHQNNTNYRGTGEPIPDTGLKVEPGWWRKPMQEFSEQVKVHCHSCGIPQKGFGSLANGGQVEQISRTHLPMVKLKDNRAVVEVHSPEQLGENHLHKSTDYIENGSLR